MPRRVFERPDAVLHARTLRDVRDVIVQAEQAAGEGKTAIGFVAYEAAPAFDGAMLVHQPNTPLAWFAVFSQESSVANAANAPTLHWHTTTSNSDVDAAIARSHEEIAAGRTYQVNYTMRMRSKLIGDAFGLYEAMRSAQGSGYHVFVETDEFAVISASPELFFEVDGRRIVTRPMKGTRRRGRWIEEDEALAVELADSDKDRAENLMIVDLLRNDLGRIAKYGTVRPVSLFDVERFGTVHQMTSTIDAELRDDASLLDVFEALFPCGSVTGAPKISTMQLIHELEPQARGVYCGAIGIVERRRTTFNVGIRTVFLRNGDATYGTGAGITFDSATDAEYDEMLAKANVLTESWPAFELLETLRLEDGNFVRLPWHLERLHNSADYFDFEWDEIAIGAALTAVPSAGTHRVRLLLGRDGSARCEWQPLDVVVMRLKFAKQPVDSANRFLYHKTTIRYMYEDDALHYNERGEVTEFARGNVVVQIGGKRYTPPISSGVLPGVFRRELLERGEIAERTLSVEDVKKSERTWMINSLREWVEVDLGQRT